MTKSEWKKWWRNTRIAAKEYAYNFDPKCKGDVVNFYVLMPFSGNSTLQYMQTMEFKIRIGGKHE